MPERVPYEYAVVRVVPRVDRDEFVNAGVIVFSRTRRVLAASTHVDEARLRALWADIDVESVRRHLEGIHRICEGNPAGGPIAAMSQTERFHWLTSPRSAVIQVSPVRTGLSESPETVVAHLSRELLGMD
jgi:DUF3037 family protein